jgi:hypothetical protein
MTVLEAIQIIKDNVPAFERNAGYSKECVEAIIILHMEWFKNPLTASCRECVQSGKNRVFNYYLNTYQRKLNDTPTT